MLAERAHKTGRDGGGADASGVIRFFRNVREENRHRTNRRRVCSVRAAASDFICGTREAGRMADGGASCVVRHGIESASCRRRRLVRVTGRGVPLGQRPLQISAILLIFAR